MEKNKSHRKAYKIIITIAVILGLLNLDIIQTPAAENTTRESIRVRYGQTEGRKMLKMINELRTGNDAWYWNADNTTKTYCNDLAELTYDYELEKLAMQRAAEIVVSFSHTRPNGENCFSIYEENGLKKGSAGENIAYGYDTAEVMNERFWEADKLYEGQGHRRNMLSAKFTTVGIGHAYYNGRHYWVEEFSSEQYSNEQTQPKDSVVAVQIELDENHAIPTPKPTATPKPTVTKAPTKAPTATVTKAPTKVPTATVTKAPTKVPTVTKAPTKAPTATVTKAPTKVPTVTKAPTKAPTATVTKAPTKVPTVTKAPTKVPTVTATKAPTKVPTVTKAPTKAPTATVTKAPTKVPTVTKAPTKVPTVTATKAPTKVPTVTATKAPTATVTKAPTKVPTATVTKVPTKVPTVTATKAPTAIVTKAPTKSPVKAVKLLQPSVKVKFTGQRGIKVSWKKVKNAEGYMVYRSTKKKGAYKRIKTVSNGSKSSYTDTKTKNGRTYYYYVVAYAKTDGKTIRSPKSKSGYRKVVKSLSAPKLNKLTGTIYSINLSWSKVKNATEYQVFMQVGKGSPKCIKKTKKTKVVISGKDYGYAEQKCTVSVKAVYKKDGAQVESLHSKRIVFGR